MNIQMFEKLASEKNTLCVTISMNTHRTHPDNSTDPLQLKNLLKEAKQKIQSSTEGNTELMDKLDKVTEKIDFNNNLDSLHIFVSEKTMEIIKSSLTVPENSVSISTSFALNPLIELFNRTENYLILLLSQSGVNLYAAENGTITQEIKNDDFPFDKNTHFLVDTEKISDAKLVDNQIRQFLNEVDNALIKVYNTMDLKCVVVCTESNYSKLMQVKNNAAVYLGMVNINYNDFSEKKIAADTWELVKNNLKEKRVKKITEMKESLTNSKVLTVLSEIFKASKEGRGELLILNKEYHQPVKMTGEFSFELSDDKTNSEVTDDISGNIALNVLSGKGKVIFANKEELDSLGDIVLKVRY
ncbi:hypothetical protein BH10BAC5_BH10BAC5_02430 [soil metagenome]